MRVIRGYWEKAYPWILSIVVGGILCRWPPAISSRDFTQMTSTVVSVAAIVIGFVATLMTIVVALGETRALKFIKNAGRYGQLLHYIRVPITAGFLLAALSLLFAMQIISPTYMHWEVAVWTAVDVLVGASLYRLTNIIFNLLRNK